MEKHNISINVILDRQKMPEHIEWSATGKVQDSYSPAKAFMVSLWDGNERSALRMDLWNKQMMVDEMNDFFFQTLMTMADTYIRATNNEDIAEEMRVFARSFKEKADAKLQTESTKDENNN